MLHHCNYNLTGVWVQIKLQTFKNDVYFNYSKHGQQREEQVLFQMKIPFWKKGSVVVKRWSGPKDDLKVCCTVQRFKIIFKDNDINKY